MTLRREGLVAGMRCVRDNETLAVSARAVVRCIRIPVERSSREIADPASSTRGCQAHARARIGGDVGAMLHGVLVAIDWAHLAHVNGEGVEKLAALLLRHQYPDAWQINPSQGDGGIDVYRRTPNGLQVWQIKRFSTPLLGGQRKQVRQSWSRFYSAHPAQGTPIHSYTLVTVWTPTEPAREWWNSKVVSGAAFPVFWDGDLFFNSLILSSRM